MDNPNNLTYCKNTTKNHDLASRYKKCVQKIDSVCINDGAKRTCFEDEICLNLDEYEIFIAKNDRRDNQKSMDLSFGVKSSNEKVKMMILVELRLNYKNFRNLSKKELDEKINHSKVILGNTPLIQNHYYFIFNSQIKSQAHNYLRRLYSNKKVISGLDLNDLKSLYF